MRDVSKTPAVSLAAASLVLAGLVSLLISATTISAQPPQPSQTQAAAAQAKTPDLSGIWEQGGGMAETRKFTREDAPLTPPMLAKYKANRAGVTNPNDKGLDSLDPLTYCFPPGAARSMIMPYPFHILQTPGAVYILFEFGSGIRIIHTDGRKHGDPAQPSWMGDSIGTWQGDTLVVDTTGFRPETWLDPAGTPHSDVLHMIERFRRTSPTALEVQFQFEDQQAYTKSWGGTRLYQVGRDEIQPYYVCEDDLQEGKMPALPAAP